MSQRFSNFDDEEPSSLRSTPNKTESETAKESSTGHSAPSERFRQTTATDASFDDFDTDWESDTPTAPLRTQSPPSTASLGARPSQTRSATPGGGRGQISSQEEDSSTFEISRGSDLERRARALDEDDDFDRDGAFGTRRAASMATGSSRIPAGMTLNAFRSSSSGAEDSDHFQHQASSSNSKPSSDRYNGARETKYESSMPPMPQVQYEPFSVEPPSHYQNYLYLLKYIHGLKILCGLHLLYTILALVFKVWYLLGGLLVAPFGFFAVHKLDRRLILIWGALFLVDTLAEAIGALVNSGKTVEQGGGVAVTITHMSIVVLRFGFSYLIYRFWTKLPENAAEYFALFTSTPERAEVV